MASPLPMFTPQLHKINLYPFYYGIAVVGTITIVLALYNLLIIGFFRHQRRFQPSNHSVDCASQSFENSSANLFPSFKYKESNKQVSDSECSVCLSNFQDGEEVRRMPCKHSFHAECIDMWFHSHSDCPLCRAVVLPMPAVCDSSVSFTEDSSRVV